MATETADGTPYYVFWVFLTIVLVGLIAKVKSLNPNPIVTTDFKNFQRSFVHVYMIALGSEWLQNCYLYVVLHKTYGYSPSEISKIYIVGLCSCQFMGVIWDVLDVGSKHGRTIMCFGLQATSCILMLVGGRSWPVALAARVAAGAASSVLQGSLDQWMVGQHFGRGFPDEWLTQTFNQLSYATAKLAIAIGIIGELAVELFGLRGPFAAAAAAAGLGAFLARAVWRRDQRRGAPSPSAVGSALSKGIKSMDKKALLAAALGLAGEAAAAAFAYLWAPALGAARRRAGEEDTSPLYAEGAPYALVLSALLCAGLAGGLAHKAAAQSAAAPPTGTKAVAGTAAAAAGRARAPAAVARGAQAAGALAYALFAAAVGPARGSQYAVVAAAAAAQALAGAALPAVGGLRGRHIGPDARPAAALAVRAGTVGLGGALLSLAGGDAALGCLGAAGMLAVGAAASHLLLLATAPTISTSLSPANNNNNSNANPAAATPQA